MKLDNQYYVDFSTEAVDIFIVYFKSMRHRMQFNSVWRPFTCLKVVSAED